jgi:hypothetical protein
MTTWKRVGGSFLAAAFLVGMSLGAPPKAEARGGGHHDHYRPHAHVGVHLGYWGGPYWGAGWWGPAWWGPYWGPYWGYPYYPEGGVSMHAAMLADYGAIKVDAKPKQAEVWADGKPIAEARDLDGTPSYLWLKAGEHRIQIYEGGFVTFDQKVDVHAGMRTELRVRLEPGPSVPPSGKAPETK